MLRHLYLSCMVLLTVNSYNITQCDVCLNTAGSLDAMKDLVAESAIMKTFHHPNVLPLLGVCIDYDDEDVLKIVIPLMANGDLRTFLKDSRVSPDNTQEYPEVCNKHDHTVNKERFAGLNFHVFHSFQEYCESFSVNLSSL